MKKDTFRSLFFDIAAQAIEQARKLLSIVFPSEFIVKMHGAGISGGIISPDEALDLMYIDETKFYRIIDVGVKMIQSDLTVLFVRISAHAPSYFDETWNTPKGNGPFKIILPSIFDY